MGVRLIASSGGRGDSAAMLSSIGLSLTVTLAKTQQSFMNIDDVAPLELCLDNDRSLI